MKTPTHPLIPDKSTPLGKLGRLLRWLISGKLARSKLFVMVATGTFKRGVTAEDLAAVKCEKIGRKGMPSGRWETLLHVAARCGHYPGGTSLEILAETLDAEHKTALSVALAAAARKGVDLPSGTTATALAALKYPWGETALHLAMYHGLELEGCTPELLIQTTYRGGSALQVGAENGFLIPGTTIKHLKIEPGFALGDFVGVVGSFQGFTQRMQLRVKRSTKNLLLASIASVPNVMTCCELQELAEVFQFAAPVETALWVAAEMVALRDDKIP